MTRTENKIILFTYDISVYGRKIDWYLTLRGIKYNQCKQPNRMPRPDLEALGIAYRRIPILAIGRDVYCDSRLIIDKLETLLPTDTLGSQQPFEQGLEKILSTWSQDGGPFMRTAQCIPHDYDVMLDQEWIRDRTDAMGADFTPDFLKAMRPEALAHLKIYLDTIEHGLLADGRSFILETAEPSLADLQAIWTFEWLTGKSMKMGDALDPEIISDARYPRVYGWIRRFRTAVERAQQAHGSPNVMSRDEAMSSILISEFWEKEGVVDPLDPLKLRKGQEVEVFPIDMHVHKHDNGELVSLNTREVVIQSKVQEGDGFLRLHFPRTSFRIRPLQD